MELKCEVKMYLKCGYLHFNSVLGWAGLGWAGLGCLGPGRARLGWAGSALVGLGWPLLGLLARLAGARRVWVEQSDGSSARFHPFVAGLKNCNVVVHVSLLLA